MKLPSNAQARVLSRIAELDRDGHAVLWNEDAKHRRATVFYEDVDRDRDRAGLRYMFRANREQPLVTTMQVLVREGWLDDSDERVFASGLPIIGVYFQYERDAAIARELALTEDGRIALGVWRERRLQTPPETVVLSEREREVIELADRALALGYVLCAREPSRKEARRMRKAGLFDGCWVGHHPSGLVPAAPAVVEVFPDRADRPEQPRRLV